MTIINIVSHKCMKKYLRIRFSFIILLGFLTVEIFGGERVNKTLNFENELRVVNIPSNAILTEFMGKNIDNTYYIIRHTHDLSSYIGGLDVGKNCILEFRNGGLKNGKLKCGNVSIKGKRTKFVDTYIEITDASNVILKNINASYSFATDDFVRVTNSENIDISGVKVVFDEGNRQLSNGAYIEAEGFDLTNCHNVSFKKCSIINSKSHYADSKHGSLICKGCKNVKVLDCYSSGGHNEIFSFIDCYKVIINNTVVRGGSGSAISTQGGEDFMINNCKSYNVGASGFSFNSKKMQITNCIAKDWHIFNGITIGHPTDNMRVSDVFVSSCKMILKKNENTQRKCALGGVIEGQVVIKECKIKTNRLCSFDGVNHSEQTKLVLDGNDIDICNGDFTANYFRASDIYNLEIIGNVFNGNVDISLLGFCSKDILDGGKKMSICDNVFKKGASINIPVELIGLKNVNFEGNVKNGKEYKLR